MAPTQTKNNSSRLWANKGFTLIEMIVVIALILTLVSILLPMAMNKLSDADNTSADATISGIAVALTNFFKDIGHFPTCHEDSSCSPFTSSTSNDLVFLAFGDQVDLGDFGNAAGGGSLVAKYPDSDTGAGNWDLTVNDEPTPGRNNAYRHLVVNDPNFNGTANDADTSVIPNVFDYASSSASGGTTKFWRGPYLARTNLDPWGRTFIAYVGAMEKDGKKVAGATAKQQGWILSAGPNNKLDTLPHSLALSGDDRGFIFFNSP